MKILVTGGAGFVGSVLVPMLLSKNYKVRVLDNLMFGIDGLFNCFNHKNFEFVKGDIRNKNLMEKVVEDIDVVIHLASLVGYPICKKYEKDACVVNVEATMTLSRILPKDKLVIYPSTDSCYGSFGELCTEETLLKPLTLYGETKAAAEILLRERGNTIILRFATGFGVSPRMRLDLLINDFCYKAVKERNLIVYEKSYQRAFVYVTDMARAFIFALGNAVEMRDGVYNIGSEKLNLTKEQVAELIRKKTEYYLHYADFGKDADQRNYRVSCEKMRKLGFETEISLEQGIDQLIELFKVLELPKIYSNV